MPGIDCVHACMLVRLYWQERSLRGVKALTANRMAPSLLPDSQFTLLSLCRGNPLLTKFNIHQVLCGLAPQNAVNH